MKTKIIIAFTAFLLTTIQLKAQNRLYGGFEIAKIEDQYILTDPTSNIGAPIAYSDYVPSVSLLVGYEINPWLSFETALTSKPTKLGYSISNNHNSGCSSGFHRMSAYGGGANLQIPLRLKTSIKLYKSFYLNTAIGYHFGITGDEINYTEQDFGGGESSGPSYSTSHIATVQQFKNNYQLIEAGVGITYQLNDRISFYVKAASFHGKDVIDKVNVQFEDSQNYSSTNSILNNGSYTSYGFGMNFRFKSFNK